MEYILKHIKRAMKLLNFICLIYKSISAQRNADNPHKDELNNYNVTEKAHIKHSPQNLNASVRKLLCLFSLYKQNINWCNRDS